MKLLRNKIIYLDQKHTRYYTLDFENDNVVNNLTERCGSSLALREEQASCSTEGAAPEEQMKPGKLDEFQWKLNSMDLYLLKYFEGNCLCALLLASATILSLFSLLH